MNRRKLPKLAFVALAACLASLAIPHVANAQGKGKGKGNDQAKAQEKAQVKAEVQELHKRLAELKKQRPATIKRIHDMFDKMIKQDKMTKVEIDEHKKHLIQERNALAAGAATPAEKKAIHEHFDSVIHQMGSGEKMEKKQIEELKKERHKMVENVEHQYNAAIKSLEAQIKATKGAGKK